MVISVFGMMAAMFTDSIFKKVGQKLGLCLGLKVLLWPSISKE